VTQLHGLVAPTDVYAVSLWKWVWLISHTQSNDSFCYLPWEILFDC
jgi:hypothetical protein